MEPTGFRRVLTWLFLGMVVVAAVWAMWPKRNYMEDLKEASALAMAGKPVSVRALLDLNPSVAKHRWPDGSTMINVAARSGFLEVVKAFHENGAVVSAEGAGPLVAHEVLRDGAVVAHTDKVIQLLEYLQDKLGVSLEIPDRDGVKPIHLAALMGQPTLALWLKSRNVDVSAKDQSGLTPLDYALRAGATVAAKALAQAGFPRGAYQPPPEPAAR